MDLNEVERFRSTIPVRSSALRVLVQDESPRVAVTSIAGIGASGALGIAAMVSTFFLSLRRPSRSDSR